MVMTGYLYLLAKGQKDESFLGQSDESYFRDRENTESEEVLVRVLIVFPRESSGHKRLSVSFNA